MALRSGSSPARSRGQRPAVASLTRRHVLSAWRRALDAAGVAAESAYELKAIDKEALNREKRELRGERDWLARLARNTVARLP
jgi:hypothetical protein